VLRSQEVKRAVKGKAATKTAGKRKPAKSAPRKPGGKPKARRKPAKRRPIREAAPAPQDDLDGVAADAVYNLRKYIHSELISNSINLLRGRNHVDGDLALDWDSEDEDCPDGTIVDGDLEVTGTIVNRNSDSGPFLLVTGNLHAKNLVTGGSEIVVLGDLIVDGVIFGFYNHGSITVYGATRAQAIITEYHAFDLRGRVEGITISGRGRITDDDHFHSYSPVLVADVLTDGNPSGGYPDWDLTTEAILAGRPVLRDDVVLN
jgi:hypothetical protein